MMMIVVGNDLLIWWCSAYITCLIGPIDNFIGRGPMGSWKICNARCLVDSLTQVMTLFKSTLISASWMDESTKEEMSAAIRLQRWTLIGFRWLLRRQYSKKSENGKCCSFRSVYMLLRPLLRCCLFIVCFFFLSPLLCWPTRSFRSCLSFHGSKT